MIYITGDTHGNWKSRLHHDVFPEGDTLSKNDYVIICGDFGLWHDTEDKQFHIIFPQLKKIEEHLKKEGLEEKFKRNEERLNRIRSGKYDAKNVVELQKLDKLFLLFSIIEGADDNAYPHQTNLHEHSVRSIDEWKREQAKGHGMDWER